MECFCDSPKHVLHVLNAASAMIGVWYVSTNARSRMCWTAVAIQYFGFYLHTCIFRRTDREKEVNIWFVVFLVGVVNMRDWRRRSLNSI
jgi:hypothetical protein